MKTPNHPKKGDRIAVEPIRKIKDLKAISKYLKDNPRDQLLFVMGINNGLRACDLLNLKVGQVRGLKAGGAITIKESKTGKESENSHQKGYYRNDNYFHLVLSGKTQLKNFILSDLFTLFIESNDLASHITAHLSR